MKKNKLNTEDFNLKEHSDQIIHIRRCHLCDTVTEHDEIVDRCQGCQKSLTPFFFCETTRETEITLLSRDIFTTKNKGLRSIYPPLVGIAFYW